MNRINWDAVFSKCIGYIAFIMVVDFTINFIKFIGWAINHIRIVIAV